MGRQRSCRLGRPTRPQCVVRPWGRGQGHESEGWGERAHEECQDSLLPWGISLELVPPAAAAMLPSSMSVPVVQGSASSGTDVCSCCRPPQLALFSPMWPNIVWDRRVSEKRAHSANSGSATYVMKPEGAEEAGGGAKYWIQHLTERWTQRKRNTATHLFEFCQLCLSLCHKVGWLQVCASSQCLLHKHNEMWDVKLTNELCCGSRE